VLRTAGAPAAIRAFAESRKVGSGFDDVAAVRFEIVDAKGVLVPNARDVLTVAVTGPAALAAFDNGGVTDHTAFASPQRAAAGGKAVAFVRGTGSGQVTVLATAPDLKPGHITLQAKAD
jgi:beta-galactosidase